MRAAGSTTTRSCSLRRPTRPCRVRACPRSTPTHARRSRALFDETQRLGLSSVHVNFAAPEDLVALDAAHGWLPRFDYQFHWTNRGYGAFDDFLAALTSKRRKEIRRERAPFASPAWRFEWRSGRELDADDLAFVYACYVHTFEDKGNYPALTQRVFEALAREMPEAVRVLIASEHGERVAMTYGLEGAGTYYGRYWGALRHVPGLHFECCYYRGLEHCIDTGLARFEPGAQGEHKLARGFLPAATHSRHWVADPALRDAIARALARESAWFAQYHESLMAHSPYARR